MCGWYLVWTFTYQTACMSESLGALARRDGSAGSHDAAEIYSLK